MAGHMARAPAAAIKQPADRCRNLISELRPPVAEPLQRQAMRLAIFPLIQVACGPAFADANARKPPAPHASSPSFAARSSLLFHRHRRGRQDRNRQAENNCAISVRLRYCRLDSLFACNISLFVPQFSLFVFAGNIQQIDHNNTIIYDVKLSVKNGDFGRFFPVFSLIIGNSSPRRVRRRLHTPPSSPGLSGRVFESPNNLDISVA